MRVAQRIIRLLLLAQHGCVWRIGMQIYNKDNGRIQAKVSCVLKTPEQIKAVLACNRIFHSEIVDTSQPEAGRGERQQECIIISIHFSVFFCALNDLPKILQIDTANPRRLSY